MSSNPDLVLRFGLSAELNNGKRIITLLRNVIGLSSQHGHRQGKWELGSVGIGKSYYDREKNWRNYDDVIASANDLQKVFDQNDLTLALTLHYTGYGGSQTLFGTLEWEPDTNQPVWLRFWMQHITGFTKKDQRDGVDYREDNAANILAFAKAVYQVCRPQFSWIERCRSRGYTQLEDIENQSLPHIYWANLFSPAYVEKLGRSYLENAPGWKHEYLDDGGMLYVLSPHIGSMRKGNSLLESVKTYFEIDSVRCK
jgi:hypothetical protein